MAHTPGPWEAELQERRANYTERHWTIEAPILDRTGSVADTLNMDHCITLEEEQANAYLLAAAPELLAALKSVVAIADRQTDEFDAARAAIAKAEGRI